MNTVDHKILETSLELFFKYGVRSVTMSDIAKELGISKKTIYQYIDNKAELVKKVVGLIIYEECEACEKILQPEKNAIDEMLEIGNYVYRQLSMVNLNMIYDLKKYYADSWDIIEAHRKKFVASVIHQNIDKGVEQGLYRANLNADIITRLYLAKMQSIVNDDYFQKHQLRPAKIFIEAFKYHVYGIASDKGIEYLRSNLKKFKKK